MNEKLFGIGLFFVAVWFFGTEHHRTVVVDSSPSHHFNIGATATLAARGPIVVAATYPDWQRMRKLSEAGDTEGLAGMAAEGRIRPMTNGPKVRVIDPGVFCSEVRFLDGPLAGASAFVGAGYLVP